MKLYWYYDAFRHTCLNGEGKDYTPAYLPLLLKNSGYSVERLPAERLSSLVAGDVLLLGAEVLSEEQSAALQVALSRGCAVIAFGAVAAGVFPEFTREIGNEDVYNVLGYFRFSGGEEPLPVLGSAGVLAPEAGEILGGLTEADGAFCPLYVRLGERVWYWSFDLPGSLWRAADGRPTTEGKNGFSLGRIPDGYVVGPGHNYSVAYADSYMRCLEEILSGAGFPRFYPLPVREGMPCDLALYFGGDDDATSSEIDLKAAANMRERGLPYHLNLMPMDEEGHFRLTREQVQQLHEGGCETAIHYNFLMFPYSDEGHRVQSEMYERAFGEVSVGPVNHCLIQHGSAAERYRMEAENGALGDNSRFQIEPDAKDVNAFNLTGFASGTAFPRFVLCDAAHGNRPLKFCEVAMSYYEPRIRSGLPEEYRKIADYLDAGYAYGRPLQLFTHPHYISDVWGDPSPALDALDYALSYVREKGWNVWLCGPDALTYWWHDRAECVVDNVTDTGFTVKNPTAHTLALVLPAGYRAVSVDGQLGETVEKTLAGVSQRLVMLPPGQHTVSAVL